MIMMKGRVAAVTDVAVGVLPQVPKLAILPVGEKTATVEGGVVVTMILVDGGTVDVGQKGGAAADEERDAIVTSKMMDGDGGVMTQVKIARLVANSRWSISDLFDVVDRIRRVKHWVCFT
jgi:hypothetical protein